MTQHQKILMCAPDYYGVDYVINPWMQDQLGKTNPTLAQRQWQGLRKALATEAEIVLIPAYKGVPDLVFTANAGMVRGNKAIVSRFRPPERRGEETFNRSCFQENGFEILPWPENVFFEGAGDALFDRVQPIVWCGHGFRSDAAAARQIEKLFERRAVSLRLVDARFYHLDTCLCPLAGGWLMYYPPAFDESSQETIANFVPPEKRIIVSEKDALTFACNAVDLNGKIFMNEASHGLQGKLLAAGFTTVLTPLSEFLRAGGTAKCLTLKLVEP
jgi:N-dimethylarginine dimethylaminohydrolase